jgi:methyltransferase (TIGR00027 family)
LSRYRRDGAVERPRRAVFGIGLALATAVRAIEVYRPERERIYDARFDYALLPAFWRWLMLPGVRHGLSALLERTGMGTPGMLWCRTRFIDDALANALEAGVQQVVCLGAGFDTRAYRLPGVERTRFFELDLPEPQSLKREHLQKRIGSLPAHVTFVPIDFNRQSMTDELAAAGYHPGVRTFFIWEGVTQYITAEAVDATLEFATSAAPGSEIAFTYIDRGIIDGSNWSKIDQRIMSRVQRRGMPWVFGLDPTEVEEWFEGRGFRLVDHAGATDYRARYLAPVGRQATIYEGERMVLAEVVGAPGAAVPA